MSHLAPVVAAAAAAATGSGGRGRVSARLAAVFGTGPRVRPGVEAAAVVAALAAAVAAGLPWEAGAVVAAGIALVGRAAARRAAERDAQARRCAVIDVVAALAGELRAGAPPAAALRVAADSAGPLSGPLLSAAGAVAAGAPGPDELAGLARLPDCEGLGYVAAAWQVAVDAGGRVAVALDGLIDALDADVAARRELAAAMAGPRATMLVLGLLPVGGLALGQAVGARPMTLLLHRPLGWALASAAAVLDLAGIAWVARLVRGAERVQ